MTSLRLAGCGSSTRLTAMLAAAAGGAQHHLDRTGPPRRSSRAHPLDRIDAIITKLEFTRQGFEAIKYSIVRVRLESGGEPLPPGADARIITRFERCGSSIRPPFSGALITDVACRRMPDEMGESGSRDAVDGPPPNSRQCPPTPGTPSPPARFSMRSRGMRSLPGLERR
jgi:hypothetical protein